MKNFKNHNQAGIGLIEVVLAVFISGAMLSSLLLLQGTIFSGLVTVSSRLGRTLLLKDYLSQIAFAREKKEAEASKSPQTKKIDDPETTMRYELKKPSKDSSLKFFEHVMIEHYSAEWKELAEKREEAMITFLFKPEKQQA